MRKMNRRIVVFIIDKSKHYECVNCGRKPEIEIEMSMVTIDLCGRCAEMLGQMLVEAVEEDEDE